MASISDWKSEQRFTSSSGTVLDVVVLDVVVGAVVDVLDVVVLDVVVSYLMVTSPSPA